MLLDNELLKEIEETLTDIRLLRVDVRKNPSRISKRGQDQPNPLYLLLRDRCLERDRLLRLAYARNLDVNVDEELTESGILDGD
jgi:hypothetical protein